MVHVCILSSSPAIRLGLQSLLEAEYSVQVYGDLTFLDELHDLSILVIIYVPLNGEESEIESLRGQLAGGEALLVLTDHIEVVRTLSELPLRGWGILSPTASGEELKAAIEAVHEGLVVLNTVVAKKVIQSYSKQATEANDTALEQLTDRETEVLQLITQGLSNKQIAHQLNISPHTVKFHISSIYTKLGSENRTEAVRIGLLNGLVIL